jgi:hypothetical protein
MNTMCVQADRILSKPVGLGYRGIVQLRRPCIILAASVLGFPSRPHNTYGTFQSRETVSS